MLAAALATLALVLVVGLGWVSYRLFGRASRARQSLAEEIYQAALAAGLRCDYQQRELDRLAQRSRIAYLSDLIEGGAAEGQLAPEVVPRLRRFVLDLHEESLELELREPPTIA